MYAFDVDETLEISGGPVLLNDLIVLRQAGHCLGLCGNWGLATQLIRNWHVLFSFVGPLGTPKDEMLRMLSSYILAEECILVGNDPALFGASNDVEAARLAGWRFLTEERFAQGER